MKKQRGDAVAGLLTIDWEVRKTDWHGMDGWSMTDADAVLKVGDEEEKAGRDVFYLIWWKDNGQLAVHDRGGFEAEIFEEKEE